MNTKIFMTICLFYFLAINVMVAQDGKDLTPPEGKALLYIYRPSVAGTVVPMPVICDETMIGTTKGKTFVYAFVDPGKHTITAEAEKPATLDIETEADKVYYIRQKVKMGAWSARTDLELVDEKEGKEKLNKCCKMPKNWTPKE